MTASRRGSCWKASVHSRFGARPLFMKEQSYLAKDYVKEQIENALGAAIDLLLTADEDTLRLDINERTISHRLAMYLEPHFPGWNVDCEYNRDHDDMKRLDIKRRNVNSDDTQATTVSLTLLFIEGRQSRTSW